VNAVAAKGLLQFLPNRIVPAAVFLLGVHNYSISLHPQTGQLFAYAEIEDEARWNAIAQTPVCRRWWDHMAGLMEVNADNSPRAIELREMFHLE
jgi:L-rhamnose mutarotase